MQDRIVGIDYNAPIRNGAALWQLDHAVVALAAGDNHNLLLTDTGLVLASGSNLFGESNVPHNLGDVEAIAAGSTHSLALKADGTVVAWGRNTRGQTNIPPGLSDVVAISAGASHSAAIRRDGGVVVWGELGAGPVNPPNELRDGVSVASGPDCCLVIRADSSVAAWGQISGGGDGRKLWDVPSTDDLNGVVGIGCNSFGWVALVRDGSIVTSGSNRPPENLTQVADPSVQSLVDSFGKPRWSSHTVPYELVTEDDPWSRHYRGSEGPMPHPPLTGVVEIVVGGSHVLARRADGALASWGLEIERFTIPYDLRDTTTVAAGRVHSLALRSDGRIVAWGATGERLSAPWGASEEFAAWRQGGYHLPSLRA